MRTDILFSHRIALTVLALAYGTTCAFGQIEPPAPGDPKRTIPEKIDPQPAPLPKLLPDGGPSQSRPAEPSAQMPSSDGIIRPPPGIDPEAVIVPPDPGTTPIIRPPKMPGATTPHPPSVPRQ